MRCRCAGQVLSVHLLTVSSGNSPDRVSGAGDDVRQRCSIAAARHARQHSRATGVPDDVDRSAPACTHSRTSVAFLARRSCRHFSVRIQTLSPPGSVLAVDRRGCRRPGMVRSGRRVCPGRPAAGPCRRICSPPTSSNTVSSRGWGGPTPTMRCCAINAISPAAPTRHTCGWEPIAAPLQKNGGSWTTVVLAGDDGLTATCTWGGSADQPPPGSAPETSCPWTHARSSRSVSGGSSQGSQGDLSTIVGYSGDDVVGVRYHSERYGDVVATVGEERFALWMPGDELHGGRPNGRRRRESDVRRRGLLRASDCLLAVDPMPGQPADNYRRRAGRSEAIQPSDFTTGAMLGSRSAVAQNCR